MRNERLYTRGFPPRGGRKGGTLGVSPLFQRGSPTTRWGVGISWCDWLLEGASTLQRPSHTRNHERRAHPVRPDHVGTAEPFGVHGRGFMNE